MSASLAAATLQNISLLWSLPFVALLACIAGMPFIHRHWWEKNYPLVAAGLGAIPVIYYFVILRQPGPWLHGMEDYIGFIILLGSLFMVSGGIVIHVGRRATPLANSILLLIGAMLANLFGTTGASMLLIRPYLRMNRGHIKPYHVVFFIFLVSNIGGLLTPIGDPPLFLGYLNGIPFWWVFEKCRWAWIIAVGGVLLTFLAIDFYDHGKSERRPPDDPGPAIHIVGIQNLLFIALVVGAVFRPGSITVLRQMNESGLSLLQLGRLISSRELIMLVAAVGSRLLTPVSVYQRNEFSYEPIREVAILFLGIFSTMAPALQWLNANAHHMPLRSPGQFYFSCGSLSAVLDNAPTYLTFLQVELAQIDNAHVDAAAAQLTRMAAEKSLVIQPDLDPAVQDAVSAAIQYQPKAVLAGNLSRQQVRISFLLGDPRLSLNVMAISLASVLFGALTYIGNGPNLMVKSIAESAGARTPDFVSYIFKYSLPLLIPIYLLIWLLFF